MAENEQILATALGRAAAHVGGVSKIVLPNSLGSVFRKAVAQAVNEASDEAYGVVVGDRTDEGEIVADKAIQFRSPEEEGTSTVVIVTTQSQAGQFKKSLELARDLLVDGLPGKLAEGPSATIDIDNLSREVAALSLDSHCDESRLADCVEQVACFLAEAYAEFGNDQKPWPAAFMTHFDLLAGNLPSALEMVEPGLPNREVVAVHFAAGLPRPVDGVAYSAKNDPKNYAKIIEERWSSYDEVARALAEIEEIDGPEARLANIDWETLPISRMNNGHPILAVCSNGYSTPAREEWLRAWAQTTEPGFFYERHAPEITTKLMVQLEDSNWEEAPILAEGADIIVLPQPGKRIKPSEDLHLCNVKLIIELREHVDTELAESLQFEFRPNSDAQLELGRIEVVQDRVEVTATLRKSIGVKGGKWKEKPLSLYFWSDINTPNNPFREPTRVSLAVPNPTRPVVYGVEESNGKRKPKVQFQGPSKVLRDEEANELVHDFDMDMPSISFSDAETKFSLAVIGAGATPRWADGNELKFESSSAWIKFFKLGRLPEDTTLQVEDYKLQLDWPIIESGQVAPVTAAILGEPLIPINENLRAALEQDPRFELERWLRDQCIDHMPKEEFRGCLGTALIATNSGTDDPGLEWSEEFGAFSNLPSNAPAAFPSGLSERPEVAKFWDAFEALRLQDLVGGNDDTALPSAIDLRELEPHQIDAYLCAYKGLLEAINPAQAKSAWAGYPLSGILYSPVTGAFEGVLLSPLHPLRLAWHWSVQLEAEKLQKLEHFASVAHSFLRFVDGDAFPLVGPSLAAPKRLLSLGLDAGPDDFFASWHFLASVEFHKSGNERKAKILGLDLPLGSPSGLDEGGISAAIRDYLRVYPMGPELRIGLASQGTRDRFAETDQAVISATQQLLDKARDELPGGVRVIDSPARTGRAPEAWKVLGSVKVAGDSRSSAGRPPLEWLVGDDGQKVDLQFLEDSVVSLDLMVDSQSSPDESLGTAGGKLPITRFKTWRALQGAGHSAVLNTGVTSNSFSGIAGFTEALTTLEGLAFDGKVGLVNSDLQIGQALFSDKARWTVTGNSFLDPASLSRKLRDDSVGLALWEWRPAFLARNQQRGVRASVSSTQPYTILAKQSPALQQEIASHLTTAGVTGSAEIASELVSSLGARAIGLSSLLTMGNTHSMGALGFAFAFKALQGWELDSEEDEIRCILPLDAVFPLLDTLSVGAKTVDDQRRADLLLIKAKLPKRIAQGDWANNTVAQIFLQPVEIKARAGSGSFPDRASSAIKDPLEQLSSSQKVIQKACDNLMTHGENSQLLGSAFATLVEAAFALKPHELRAAPSVETRVLEAVASGRLSISSTPGTLLWFQGAGKSQGGAGYEPRQGELTRPGQVLANFETLADCNGGGAFCSTVAGVVESTFPEYASSPAEPYEPETQEADLVTNEDQPARVEPIGGGVSEEPAEPDVELKGQSQEADHAAQDNGNSVSERPAPEGKENGQVPIHATPSLGIEVLVGQEFQGTSSSPVLFKPSNTELTQMNMGVVGDLGTGKTQFLKSLVYQLSQSAASNRGKAPKTFIFDYKKDYSAGEFPESISAQVLDPTRTLPINFFALPEGATNIQKVYRANFFKDLLQRIANIGAVQGTNLYASVMHAYGDCAPGHWPLLENILDVYRQKNGGTADTVVAKLTMMIDLEIFEKNHQNIHSFSELFTKNTVLNLSDLGGAGQDIVDIVATMFLEHLYTDYMKTIEKPGFEVGEDGTNRRFIDTMVLIDEAHHALGRGFDVLMKMMLEGREFGLGVILSSQYLSHFQLGGKNWAEALSTWAVHNVKGAKAKDLENIGFRGPTHQMAQDLSSLKAHWAYYRCANGQTEGILMKGQPFFSLPKS
ncbi:helicase HerA domain-containing protein [Qipengyuania psychrotolerans]|uniref:Helicase HerA central domain-containing protein n=1 Tax=Qipengyuania psychrotolerans TaxID=2867238 RepID=A0ABX8ZCL7_9SPHN|nr:DUF87 domain-containing protein [Qipengyuania psychrotolerans]QZD86723.1 hypothetical protein K3166_10995 [Qipengyuania psychrotolerans]